MDDKLDEYLERKYAEMKSAKILANLEALAQHKRVPYPELQHETDRAVQRAVVSAGLRHVMVSGSSAIVAVTVSAALALSWRATVGVVVLAVVAGVALSSAVAAVIRMLDVRATRVRQAAVRSGSDG